MYTQFYFFYLEKNPNMTRVNTVNTIIPHPKIDTSGVSQNHFLNLNTVLINKPKLAKQQTLSNFHNISSFK